MKDKDTILEKIGTEASALKAITEALLDIRDILQKIEEKF